MPKYAYYLSFESSAPESIIKGVKAEGGVVIHAENTVNFYEYYNSNHPACLIIDLDDAESDGIEFLKNLPERNIFLPVIVQTSKHDVLHAVNMMKAGAFDYQLKPVSTEALAISVTRALKVDQTRLNETGNRQQIQKRYETLSPREREVLKLIDSGKANKVIANVLAISSKTAETHRSRIMSKMHANNITALIQMLQTIKESNGSFCPSFSHCPKRIDLMTDSCESLPDKIC